MKNERKASTGGRRRNDSAPQDNKPALDTLTAEFDDLLARMQMPEAQSGMRDAFAASPDDLGRMALAAAVRRAG